MICRQGLTFYMMIQRIHVSKDLTTDPDTGVIFILLFRRLRLKKIEHFPRSIELSSDGTRTGLSSSHLSFILCHLILLQGTFDEAEVANID